jgi:predicted phage-related endonuclease
LVLINPEDEQLALQVKGITDSETRRSFIGGSDARIIMGSDETALIRLWREKRGEVESEDLSDNLIVQLGTVTEDLNRHWYERNTGQTLIEVQRRVVHPVKRWMAATLDGMVEGTGAVFEAKFMLPWSFSEEAAAEKHMAQLQHNMWVVQARSAVLSIITGGGKWVEMTVSCRSALSAPLAHRGEEVLALRRERRNSSFVRGRAAPAPDRGGPDRRHDVIQFLGGICRRLLPDPRSAPQS